MIKLIYTLLITLGISSICYADMPTIQGMIEFTEKAERDNCYVYLVSKSTNVSLSIKQAEANDIQKIKGNKLSFILKLAKTKDSDISEIYKIFEGYISNIKVKAMNIYTHVCNHDKGIWQCTESKRITKGGTVEPDEVEK